MYNNKAECDDYLISEKDTYSNKRIYNRMKYLVLSLFILLCSLSAASQSPTQQYQNNRSLGNTLPQQQMGSQATQSKTLTPQEIEQAKALGLSEVDIQNAINTQRTEDGNNSFNAETNQMLKSLEYDQDNQNWMQADSLRQLEKANKTRLRTIEEFRDFQEFERYLKFFETKELGDSIFGVEIFSSENLTFAPSSTLPTPKNYKLSAGDEIAVNIWGASENNFIQQISRDGNIIVPNIGPIYLAGLTIAEAEIRLKNQLSQIYAGLSAEEPNTYVKISLGQLRSIKVNIAGEVKAPGTYTLSSLSSLFNALYAAGGVNRIGSMRSIKLYRESKEIATLDVYDYLIHGKYETNVRLEDQDMIIVQPYVSRVRAVGKIKRPRIYELKKGETVEDLLTFCGGFTGDALKEQIKVNRQNGKMYSIFDVKTNEYSSFQIIDGDIVFADRIIDRYENRVRIAGSVYRPGSYALSDKMNTVKQLIEMAQGLKDETFMEKAVLTRRNDDTTPHITSINLKALMSGSIPDIELKREDSLYIATIYDMRENYTVTINGAVNFESTFTYADNMTIKDLVIMAKGFKESASLGNISVSRQIKDEYATTVSQKMAETYSFSIHDDLSIEDEAARFTLKPFDIVTVRYSPGFNPQQMVYVNGEIIFRGPYVIEKRGMRLSELVKKAGGTTGEAYIKGASITRKMTKGEKQKIESLIRLSADTTGGKKIDSTLLKIDSYKIGIDLDLALKNPGSDYDIRLIDGDSLYIPQFLNTVKISGAVLFPNATTFNSKKSLRFYIDQAGEYAEFAKRKPIVIYANGQVDVTKTRFIFFKKYPKIEPGCEIVVPMKMPKGVSNLAQIAQVSAMTTSMASVVLGMINVLKK